MAFIEYLGGSAEGMSKSQAREWLSAAMEDPNLEERRFSWNHAKLSLHPELFEEEVRLWKSARAEKLYYESFESFGLVSKNVTKAAARQAVDILDVHAPGWDAQWLQDESAIVDVLYGDVAEALEAIDPKFITGACRRGLQNRFLPTSQKPPPIPIVPMITITRDGQNYGPYEIAQIQEMLASSELQPNDLAWKEGMSDWKPLSELLSSHPLPAIRTIAPPLPPNSNNQPAGDRVFLNEAGVTVTLTRVVVGGQTFPVRNIASVQHAIEYPKRFLPVVGLILFGMFTWAFLPDLSADKARGTAVFMFVFFGALTFVCALKVFRRAKHIVVISTSGAEQKPYTGAPAFVDRIVAAINEAIIARG